MRDSRGGDGMLIRQKVRGTESGDEEGGRKREEIEMERGEKEWVVKGKNYSLVSNNESNHYLGEKVREGEREQI